jgi:hypothetical protein
MVMLLETRHSVGQVKCSATGQPEFRDRRMSFEGQLHHFRPRPRMVRVKEKLPIFNGLRDNASRNVDYLSYPGGSRNSPG